MFEQTDNFDYADINKDYIIKIVRDDESIVDGYIDTIMIGDKKILLNLLEDESSNPYIQPSIYTKNLMVFKRID